MLTADKKRPQQLGQVFWLAVCVIRDYHIMRKKDVYFPRCILTQRQTEMNVLA